MILLLETSGNVCSVALCNLAGNILESKFVTIPNGHAAHLHILIDKVTEKIAKKDLKAVAVSKGPGSYTGLRIGVSAAKGICYALSIPLIGIETTQIIAQYIADKFQTNSIIVPMIDARRMEVYTAQYNHKLEITSAIQPLILSDESCNAFFNQGNKYIVAGDGSEKLKDLIVGNPNIVVVDNVFPVAEKMAAIASSLYTEKKWEDLAYFEPEYLKEFRITATKSNL